MACPASYRSNSRASQAYGMVVMTQAKMMNKTNAEHYTWGQNCEGWHFVKSDSLSVIQESMSPHTSEMRHKHIHSRQFFFVLSGEATIEIEGESQLLTKEQGLEISPGMAHQIFNNSDIDLHFLVISCPPSHADRINIGTIMD